MSKGYYKSNYAGVKGALSVVIILGVAYGCTAWAKGSPNPADWFKDSPTHDNNSTSDVVEEVQSQLETSAKIQRGVSIFRALKTNTTQVYNYSITPASATSAKDLSYELTSAVDYDFTGKLEIVIDSNAKTISINCLDTFKEQAILKIYLTSQPDVFATMTIDFKSKINSATPTLTIAENKVFNIGLDIDETGGSIATEKTVTNIDVTMLRSFSENVISTYTAWAVSHGIDTSKSGMSFNVGNQSTSSDYSLNAFKTDSFTVEKLLKSFHISYDDSGEQKWTDFYNVNSESWIHLFDGNTPAIHVSQKLNGVVYEKDYGIKIDNIKAEKINVSATNIVF